MAAVIKGGAFIFGIDSGAVSNAVLTSINFNNEFANQGQVLNEEGQIIYERMDDLQTTGSCTMQFTGAIDKDLATSVDQFTYDGTTYWITEITKNLTNNGFGEMSFNFEYVDHATNTGDAPA